MAVKGARVINEPLFRAPPRCKMHIEIRPVFTKNGR